MRNKEKHCFDIRFWFLLAMIVNGKLLAQDSIPKRIYNTKFVGDVSVPKIDGIINDRAWDLVDWSGNYVEWSPDENTEPSQQTRLKILYDKKSLYVAFRCYDTEPDKIVSRLSRRDGFDGDWVEINLGSVGDKRTAYSFTISVSGVKGEEYITNDGGSWDNTWNPIWYAKTNVDKEGWTAEIRIPLSQVRFGKGKDQVWGIQSTRRYFRKEERSVWQRSPQNSPGWVSNFGELHGLKNLEPQKQLEIQPYIVTSLRNYDAEPGNPFRDGSELSLNGGVDGKLGITNDLTLDFTINPDFGQVEADPSAIALDGFQIFFPEQRPFFIENKNIFDYPFSSSVSNGRTFGFDNLFYSRRIGRSPQALPNLQTDEYSDQPNISTILGAAKFSGKTRDGWSIGILESVTEREIAKISNGLNERSEVVEPLTNYFVGRLQKDFNNNNTLIGGIFTATNRDIADNVDFLHKSAYTGGLDFMHQWKNRAYYFKANLIFSNVNGSVDAINRTQKSITHLFQRENTAHVSVDDTRTSLTGIGGNVQIGKASGNWRFQTGATWRSPELELNDIGFQIRADDIRHYGWLNYRTTKPLKSMRSWLVNYNHLAVMDYGGNINEILFNVNTWLNLKNNYWINPYFELKPLQFSNVALRGGPRLKLPSSYQYGLNINSDSRKKLRFSLSFTNTWFDDNALKSNSIGGSITYQPTNALQLSLLTTLTSNNDRLQYVSTNEFNGDNRYINATIDQKTLSFPLRVDYILKPNLSLQYWGQPFISRGRYKDFKYITDPTATGFTNRFSEYNSDQISLQDGSYLIDENRDGNTDYSFFQPDFAFVQWRSNLVLRWEYIPGSEFYLVWSQDLSSLGDFNENLFDGLKNNIKKPQNIFLLKATYRFVK